VNDKSMRYEPTTKLNGYSNPNIFLSDSFNGIPYGVQAGNVFGGFPIGPAIYKQQLGAFDNTAAWEADFDQNVGHTLDEQFNEYTRLPDPATTIKNPALWQFRLNDSSANSVEDDYSLSEKLTGIYLMGSYNPIKSLNVIAGARFEQAKSVVSAPIEKDNPDGSFEIITNGPYSKTFTDVLPDVLLRWEPRSDLQFRASVTSTIGRPDYILLAPKGKIQIHTGPFPDVFTGSLSVGNPDLKPYQSTNLDLSAAYYLPKQHGVIMVGLFSKNVDNPIYSYGYEATDPDADLSGTGLTRNTVNGLPVVDYQGIHFSQMAVSSQANAESGMIKGVEFTYQQDFTFLPSPFDGLGVSLNYTKIDSEVTIFNRPDQNTRFFLQPDEIENFEVYYEKNGFQARLAWHHQGDALIFLGSEPRLDEWLRARGQLDARVSYRINRLWEVYFDARNLRDDPYRTYFVGINYTFR